MRVLGIIPAQGRSVAIPLKNIATVHGKPLLSWTIESTFGSRLASVIVSTDHPQIAEVAIRYRVQIIGQPEFPSTLAMLQWAINQLDPCERPDAVMCLQPTCPLRRLEDIDAAISLMERYQCDSVVSYVSVGANHPARMAHIAGANRVFPLDKVSTFTRRQDLEPVYIRSGDIYLTKREVLESGSMVGKDQRALVIPPERFCNIDDGLDLLVAAAKMEYLCKS